MIVFMDYVAQMKKIIKHQSSTPLKKPSNTRQQETDVPLDNGTTDNIVAPEKRVIDINTQESKNYENEHTLKPDRKKIKASSSVTKGVGGSRNGEKEEDHVSLG